MAWAGFGRSLAFALGIAGLFPLYWLGGGSLLNASPPLVAYLAAGVALYLAGLGPRPPVAFAVGGVSLLAGLLIGFVPVGLEAKLGALALILGLGRSVALYRRRPGRALAVEALLLLGGLAFAASLATHGPLGIACALWGFFLVQSVYFLIPGARGRDDECEDALERALRELQITLGR